MWIEDDERYQRTSTLSWADRGGQGMLPGRGSRHIMTSATHSGDRSTGMVF